MDLAPARIDEGVSEDDWCHASDKSSQPEQLRADRHWNGPVANADADMNIGRCLGIQCNIWFRAQKQQHIKHLLCGGGKRNEGWGALRWQETTGVDEVRYGKHPQIKYLAKKITNFLHEFHGDLFPSLNLPQIPPDRSSTDIHSMLAPLDIARLLRRLKVQFM